MSQQQELTIGQAIDATFARHEREIEALKQSALEPRLAPKLWEGDYKMKDGETITGLHITGQLIAPDGAVVIARNCWVEGGGKGSIVKAFTAESITLDSCVISPKTKVPGQIGVRASNLTAINTLIESVEDGINILGGSNNLDKVTIQHLHQLRDDAHSDCLQVFGGSVTVRDCLFSNSSTDNAAIMVNQDRAAVELRVYDSQFTGDTTPAAINLAKQPYPVAEDNFTETGNTYTGYTHNII